MAKEKVSKVVNSWGTRKRAIARATVKPGKGVVRINSIPLQLCQPKIARMKMEEPLLLAQGLRDSVNISVNVFGSGIMSQADAARMAIATGLVQFSKDKKLESTYLEYDRQLLVADTRRAETSKPNNSKPRHKRQKSYR